MKNFTILIWFFFCATSLGLSQNMDLDESDITINLEEEVGQRISWTFRDGAFRSTVGKITGINNTQSGFLGLSINGARNISMITDKIEFRTDNMSTEESYSDFAFVHESGSSAAHGITFRNVGVNNNYWTFYTLDGTGNLSLTRNGTVVGTFAPDGVYTGSDKKLKKNIKPLKKVLHRLLNLTPNEYNYIGSDNHKKSIGFIAQDVDKYFPELVLDNPMDDGEVLMQLNYAGFGVLAIKAIQEQQVQIASQQLMMISHEKRIEMQDQTIVSMQTQMRDLLERISALEDQ